MRHIKLFWGLILFVFHLQVNGQNINNYTFSATNVTFTPLSGGTIPTLTGSVNEGYYSSVPINFDFWFMGVRYTTINASTNGWLSFATINNAVPANSFTSTTLPPTPYVAPLWDDLDNTQSGGIFSYQTSGNAPNRIFTAEWLNTEWNWNANNAVISFQVKLYETSGKIEFVYRQESTGVNNASASIGIASSSTAYRSLNNAGSSPVVSNSINTTNINTKPATGQVYAFSPPIYSSATNLTFSNITQNSLRINWSDPLAGELGYVIYSSTDNVNYSFVGQTAANTTLFNASTLVSGMVYYYKVYALSEGGLSIPLAGNVSTLAGTMSGTYTIPGSFSSITLALASIQANGLLGSVVLELQTSYSSAVEIFPITFNANLGTAPNKTVTIRPAANATNAAISGTHATTMIDFNGGKYVKFDGRPGGVGNTIALAINNDHLSTSNTILFQNGATADSLMYCNIRGNNTPQNQNTNAVINFSTSTSANGNDSNVISNCNIHGGDYNWPGVLIRSGGTAGKENTANLILNNYLYDYTTSASLPSNFYPAAVNIINNSKNFTISGNHIYQTQSLTSPSQGMLMKGIIAVVSSSGIVTITNNYIGGSAPFCAGNTWEVGPLTHSNSIVAIDVTGNNSINQPSIIEGNVIANYLLGAGGNSPRFTGIYANSKANITGNTIGKTTGNSSILIVSEGSSTSVYGIEAVGAISIANNNIGAIEGAAPTSSNYLSIYGIRATNVSQINSNLIGSLSSSSSIYASNNTAVSNQYVYGVYASGIIENAQIANNTVSNLNNATTSTSSTGCAGIWINDITASSATLFGNLVQKLTNTSGSRLVGIAVNYNTSPIINIRKNSVHSLKLNNHASNTNFCGIYAEGSATNLNIEDNFVHSFELVNSSTSINLLGIRFTSATNTLIANNMVRLGIKPDGSSMATACNMYGIIRYGTNTTHFLHNSICIGGTGVGSTGYNTACFMNALSSGATDYIFNNIFCNLRSNATTGGKHYSFSSMAFGLTLNMNKNMHYTGSLNCMISYNNTDYTNFDLFKQLGYDQQGTDSLDPGFINPTGTAVAVDLHISATLPTAVEANGTAAYTTIEDFDGQVRSLFSPVDIGADAGNFNQIALPVTWLDVTAQRVSEESVSLKWGTASEKDNSHFELERSYDGDNFEYIATVKGHGQSRQPQYYSYTDYSANDATKIYYRLRQVDFSGKTTLSKILVVYSLSDMVELAAIPNPFHHKLQLNVTNTGLISVELTNLQGKALWQKQIMANGGQRTIVFNTEDLTNGIYFITIKHQTGEIQHLKVIRE